MTDPTPARFQFGIRHLLVVMVVVAALAAVMGPTMRQWSAAKWSWYTAHLLAGAAAYAVTLVRRFRAEAEHRKRAGAIHWHVPVQWELRSHLPWWGRIVLAAVLLGGIVGVLEMLCFVSIDTAAAGLWTMLCGITLGMLAGGGIFDDVNIPSQASIGDNGLLIGQMFLPWEMLDCSPWLSGGRMRIEWPDRFLACSLEIPAEERQAITTFLRSREREAAGNADPRGLQ